MSELYKFGKLDAKLTEWGFPIIDSKSGFQSIRVDFTKAYKAGKIEFREDGIYLIHEGKEWKGYMYMPTYRVAHYGDVSRFHLTRCKVIADFISKGMFNTYYIWSNNKTNDIEDRDTGEIHKDQTLQLCSNCKKAILGIDNTEDFFETLDITEQKDTNIEVDIFGYDKNWQKISRVYRQSKDYVCENCGIKPVNNFDKRFWHTHHKNGDKTNNNQSNLECLCVLCHSYKDHSHKENFDKTRMKRELYSFVKQYDKDLRKVGNPYLKQFETDKNADR
jgi:hypothetical protein